MAISARAKRNVWPPLIFAIIVSSFLAATALGQWRMGVLDQRIIQIAETTSSSVQDLANARGEIRNVRVALREDSAGALTPVLPRVDHAVDAYLALPVAPGEQNLWRDVIAAKRSFDDAIVSSAPAERVATTAEDLDTALTRALDFNVVRSRDLAVEVREVRRSTLRTAVGLDVACTAIAIIGALFLRRVVRMHDALLDRHRELQEQRTTELEQFAGRIAHDIMSPLGTVAIALELAKKTETGEERARLLDRGGAAVYRVKRMVTGLLDFARAGATPDPNARADVAMVISDLAAELQPTAAAAGVELSMTSPPDLFAACNPGVLTSMVANLTRNALKYMGDGPVRRVDVRVLDRGDAVKVEVEDTGPGLAPDIEGRVFDSYARSSTANKPGVGLGLATVKRLAEGHGGSVGVSSASGKGCTFWFELPKATRSLDEADSELRSDGATAYRGSTAASAHLR